MSKSRPPRRKAPTAPKNKRDAKSPQPGTPESLDALSPRERRLVLVLADIYSNPPAQSIKRDGAKDEHS